MFKLSLSHINNKKNVLLTWQILRNKLIPKNSNAPQKNRSLKVLAHTITGAVTNGAESAAIVFWYWGSLPTV